MMYPVGTPVHTFLLDANNYDEFSENNIIATVIVIVRENDGEVITKEFTDYRDAQEFANAVIDDGGQAIAVIEGERDIATGDSSVFTMRR